MILEHILSDFTLSNTTIGLESDHQVSNYLSLNDRKLVPKITTRESLRFFWTKTEI